MSLSLEQGKSLVRLARRAIETYLKDGKVLPVPRNAFPELYLPRGVFVTLNKTLGEAQELRGCIGFPEPVYPLGKGTIQSAISAAVADPRFRPVDYGELSKIIIEVSVLTPPEIIESSDPREYPDKIRIGRDGLIIERGRSRGLLLPQVPVEWGWDAEEFLMQCCIKAGIPPDSWLIDGTKVYKFQGTIFSEESPEGPVKEVTTVESEQ